MGPRKFALSRKKHYSRAPKPSQHWSTLQTTLKGTDLGQWTTPPANTIRLCKFTSDSDVDNSNTDIRHLFSNYEVESEGSWQASATWAIYPGSSSHHQVCLWCDNNFFTIACFPRMYWYQWPKVLSHYKAAIYSSWCDWELPRSQTCHIFWWSWRQSNAKEKKILSLHLNTLLDLIVLYYI